MKTQLQTTLATLAPSISIRTIWELDQFSRPISRECDGFDESADYDWQAWQSEILASAICGGEEITGSAYLGGTFEKSGDLPEYSNPTISGYENQMTQEALNELLGELERLPEQTGGNSDFLARQSVIFQIGEALEYLKAESAREYEEQRAAIESARQAPAASL